MTLPALDLEPSSAAPPGVAGAVEPAPASEAAAAKSSSSKEASAKPPPASLVSITAKGKQAVPTKAGDLSRLFELARHQARMPTAPSEASRVGPPQPPAAELESMPQPMPAAPSLVEAPGADAPSESAAPSGAVPAPVSLDTTVSVDAVSEAMIDPSFPLMLAPPVAVPLEEATVPALAEPAPAPTTEADIVAVPDWVEGAAAGEGDLAPEAPEPLEVAPLPIQGAARPTEVPDPARTYDEPAATVASTAATEPRAEPIEPLLEAEPPPAAVALVEPKPAPAPAAPRAPVFKELVDYWRSLRSGDGHPAAEMIDRDLVTERWPGTLLIAYTPGWQDPPGELHPGRVIRLGTPCSETQSVVDAGSHSTEWMLEVAHTALVNDDPVEEQQRLATVTGVAGFRMVALPLGPRGGLANAVLCTLAPSPGAPRFGKRRIWL